MILTILKFSIFPIGAGLLIWIILWAKKESQRRAEKKWKK